MITLKQKHQIKYQKICDKLNERLVETYKAIPITEDNEHYRLFNVKDSTMDGDVNGVAIYIAEECLHTIKQGYDGKLKQHIIDMYNVYLSEVIDNKDIINILSL